MGKRILVCVAIVCLSMNLMAQKVDGVKKRKAQITFGYPMGSNGMHALEYSNNFSLNILHGLNGGVHGAEFGAILNYNKGDVSGFQLSGISNINTGFSQGVLLSSVSNICMGPAKGVLISGVLNDSRQNSTGVQVGTINLSAKKLSGLQLGIVNCVHDVDGLQLGVVNCAKKVKGLQLGIVNILDDKESGLPVGLFSVVEDGLYELELMGGDVIYSNLNYKMGVEKLYTIYKAGFSTYKNKAVLSTGFGFGGKLLSSEKQSLSLDVTTNNVLYDKEWNGDLNLLNKIDVNYKRSISSHLGLIVGPSFNVYVTKEKVDGEFGTLNIPYTLYTDHFKGGKWSVWIGFNAGFSFL